MEDIKLLDDVELAKAIENRRAPTVTKDSIEAEIVGEMYIRPQDPAGNYVGTLMICVLTLANGFTVTGESACADPANFDEQIGQTIARANAFNKIWSLEGYLLKERIQHSCETAIPFGDKLVQLYLNDALQLREMLLSIRDGIETEVLIQDLLPVLDDAIQSIATGEPAAA